MNGFRPTFWRNSRYKRKLPLPLAFLVFLTLASCSSTSSSPDEVEIGFSRDEVIAVLGIPSTIQDFVLPDEPFFGPQESLTNLLPPGTMVEEWMYELDDKVMYVWFASESDLPRDEWLVIKTEVYPAGAVF
ncbi:MAG: hypothetical protein PVH03_01305 [Chloroflexota bacterium]|jgi:hypothetical protein